jgi:hypothetical protein
MNLYMLFWKRGWEMANLWELTGDLRIDAGLGRTLFHEEIVRALLEDRLVVPEFDKLDKHQRTGAEKALRSAARRVSGKYGLAGRDGGFDLTDLWKKSGEESYPRNDASTRVRLVLKTVGAPYASRLYM